MPCVANDWIAPTVERDGPDRTTGERQALEEWLDYHRGTLLTKCAGLDARKLKERAVPPSRLSLLGLVRHMTDVETWSFSIHGAGAEIKFRYDTDGRPETDFEDIDDADAEADMDAFVREIEISRVAMKGKDLEEVLASRGDHPEKTNVRWLYLHMIEEYARHNGHADLLRERIDGATGD